MKLNFSHLVFIGIIIVSGILIENAHAANQPHMYNALESLRNARHQLEVAESDKGGHRARAISIIDTAIDEVKAGIAAGN